MTLSRPAFTACPWCGTRNSWGTLECRRCGGPQPAVEIADAGQPPPPVPREVPKGYGVQVFLAQVTGLVGAIFAVVGLPFLVIFPIIGITTEIWLFVFIGGGLGGLFFGIGTIMFLLGVRQVRQKMKIYRSGIPAQGVVTAIALNRNVSVNGRHPWRVDYAFEVLGKPYRGISNAWYEIVAVGSPLHVLHDPVDPGDSVIYPPLETRKP